MSILATTPGPLGKVVRASQQRLRSLIVPTTLLLEDKADASPSEPAAPTTPTLSGAFVSPNVSPVAQGSRMDRLFAELTASPKYACARNATAHGASSLGVAASGVKPEQTKTPTAAVPVATPASGSVSGSAFAPAPPPPPPPPPPPLPPALGVPGAGAGRAAAKNEHVTALDKLQQRLRKRMHKDTRGATGSEPKAKIDPRTQQWLELQAHAHKMTVDGVFR